MQTQINNHNQGLHLLLSLMFQNILDSKITAGRRGNNFLLMPVGGTECWLEPTTADQRSYNPAGGMTHLHITCSFSKQLATGSEYTCSWMVKSCYDITVTQFAVGLLSDCSRIIRCAVRFIYKFLFVELHKKIPTDIPEAKRLYQLQEACFEVSIHFQK